MIFTLLSSVFYMLLWLIIPLIAVVGLFLLRLATRGRRKRGGVEPIDHSEPLEGGPFIEGEFADESGEDDDHNE